MALVKQKTRLPTRKMLAVILSGMIIGGIQAGLRYFWPDHPFAPVMDDLDIWLQGLVMVLTGYLTHEKQTEDVNG